MTEMETKQIISWLRDKADRADNPSWTRMMHKAADRLKELDQAQKWIPVTERLPDKFSEYIVTIKTISGVVYSDYADYDPFQQRWTTGLFFDIGSKVTHWMPLPKPHVNEEGKE